MAIDVVIKQRLFGNKTMPLDVILGEGLHYGNFVNDRLEIGELGEDEFIAYDPESIGRGFSVTWTPAEKKTVVLRLPLPSTTGELRAFYDAVARMTKHWNAKLTVDGNPTNLEFFMAGFENMVQTNKRFIEQFAQQVLCGECDTLTLYCTMLPLMVGKEEAAAFLEKPAYFSEWLHEKQSMDVYFASPKLYAGEDGIFGRYFFGNDVPAVFPNRPAAPLGATDPATQKQLVCDDWRIVLVIRGEGSPLCEIPYSKFLSIIPSDKVTKYDGGQFLLQEMSAEEICALSAK